jgi:hypothetical protein
MREFHFTLHEIFGIRNSVLYGILLLLLAMFQCTVPNIEGNNNKK